jgi:hypothetical protein
VRRSTPQWADERSSGALIALGAFGVLLLGVFFALCHLFDFHVFWAAGRDVLHGRSPYPPLGSIASDEKNYYVYPPLVALLSAPLGLLPFPAAGALAAAALVAAMYLSLRILGVRDGRCYAVCLVWAATLQAITLGTVGPLLALLLAIAWRYRNRTVVCALAVAAAVCLKLFLWPMLLWLVAMRRFRAGALSLAFALGAALAGWAAIGFAGLTSYPRLLARLSSVEEGRSFSLTALGHALGLPSAVGHVALAVAGVGLLAAIGVLARRSDGDRRAFAAAVAASLALTPILWLHYLCILAVPIAIRSPRLDRIWIVPALLALPIPTSGGNALVILWGLGVATATFVVLLRRESRTATALPTLAGPVAGVRV